MYERVDAAPAVRRRSTENNELRWLFLYHEPHQLISSTVTQFNTNLDQISFATAAVIVVTKCKKYYRLWILYLLRKWQNVYESKMVYDEAGSTYKI